MMIHSAQGRSVPTETEATLPAYCRQFAPDATGSDDLLERVVLGVSDGKHDKFTAQLLVAVLADLGTRPGFVLEPVDAVSFFSRLDAISPRGAA
jgi:hypothetical protein